METIAQSEMWSYFDGCAKARPARNSQVRGGLGHEVKSYRELANKIAELQFLNLDYVLLFRGQGLDHRNSKHNTSLKPSLFRPGRGSTQNPGFGQLLQRFEVLKNAEQRLIREYSAKNLLGKERLKRHRILRWALLQHYEVCRTPLLDVTHSLRVAASFASLTNHPRAYLYVVGVPNLSGAVTASAEGGLQIVRLSSVCPPSAVRPHIQEGYLLGEYPEMADAAQKELYYPYEIDFGRRLLAKFCFNPRSFWKDPNFPPLTQKALYPTALEDDLLRLANKVKDALPDTGD